MMDIEPQPLQVIAPDKIAQLVEAVGIRKAGLGILPTLTLGVLAGAFIAFGAMAYTVAITGSELGFGPTRLIGGVAFSLGLILVIIGGAELFTGNSLIVMAWASGRVGTGAILRNWAIVYVGNLIGAIATAIFVHVSGVLTLGDGSVGVTAENIVMAKLGISPLQAFTRGILCNILVCLAVWMSFAARSVAGKVVVIVPPIAAFVMLGFEHSVANMYLIPVGMLHKTGMIDAGMLLANLVPVTAGNIIGGGGLVALVYWLVYLRPSSHDMTR
ncbi:formate/nitrite transporter family protein [Aquisediminimonas sediminicola]|uniref:formate/nitrite transporter family protein n=1 Tax=Alteraquisediminimonas sediminicola TaxID=2676787 RepID=UPI001C8F037F|nr:formate/nitrite transporter family protein [Aquisediminimonas sediminicola]